MKCVFDKCHEAVEHTAVTKSFGVYASEIKNPNLEMHVHECCEIFLCIEGGKSFLIDNKIYDISEAVLSKNGEYAFKIISDLEKNNESALRILSVLASYFSDLYRAYVLSRENMSYPEMVEAMKFPPQRKFVADKMFKRAKSINPDFLRECISDCTKAESDVKNGVLAEWRALEVLVLKFLNA